jgi:hypothetical protein
MMPSSPSHIYFPKLDLSLLSKRPPRDAESKFPCKLHRLLQDVENEGLTDIISWHKDGNSFRVHNPEVFVEKILPRYFKKSKYRSFQRQLNLYGFHRITAVKPFWDSCYHHPDFSREDESGCRNINRPLRRKSGQDSISTGTETQSKEQQQQQESFSPKSPSHETIVNFDDFVMTSSQSNEVANTAATSSAVTMGETQGRRQTTTASVNDEEKVKQDIYDVTYNEQALTRRNSYQDLCESIMGADCDECKDGAKLLDEIMKDDSIQPGGVLFRLDFH